MSPGSYQKLIEQNKVALCLKVFFVSVDFSEKFGLRGVSFRANSRDQQNDVHKIRANFSSDERFPHNNHTLRSCTFVVIVSKDCAEIHEYAFHVLGKVIKLRLKRFLRPC